MELKIDLEMTKDVLKIVLSGDLTVQHIVALRRVLEGTVRKNIRKIILDFGQVGMLDSGGIGLIVNFNKKITKDSGYFALYNIQSEVQHVFEITHVDQLLKVIRTADELNSEIERISEDAVQSPSVLMPLENSKVLVISSSDPFRRNLRRELEKKELVVVEGINGEEGLKSFRNEIPRTVVVDSELYDRPGIKVVEEISKLSENVNLLVVYPHGINDALFFNRLSDLGIKQLVEKPVDYLNLSADIKKLLSPSADS